MENYNISQPEPIQNNSSKHLVNLIPNLLLHAHNSRSIITRLLTNAWMKVDSDFKTNEDLKLLKYDNGRFELESIGKDPQLIFTDIGFEKNKRYLLKFRITSFVNSNFHLFYTDDTLEKDKYPFSKYCSVLIPLEKGVNEFPIFLEYANLGKKLRIDPLSSMGKCIIHYIKLFKLD